MNRRTPKKGLPIKRAKASKKRLPRGTFSPCSQGVTAFEKCCGKDPNGKAERKVSDSAEERSCESAAEFLEGIRGNRESGENANGSP